MAKKSSLFAPVGFSLGGPTAKLFGGPTLRTPSLDKGPGTPPNTKARRGFPLQQVASGRLMRSMFSRESSSLQRRGNAGTLD